MNVLITGIAGLIGSHLSDKLLSVYNSKVIGIDNLSFGNINNIEKSKKYSTFQFIYNDVRNKEFLELNNINIIYHLAAYKKAPGGTINSSEIMMNNTKMIENVVELAKRNSAIIIYASTSDVYGYSKTFKEDEQLIIGPPIIERYSYALSKLYDEQFLLNLVKENKIKASIVRIFGCFSERSNRNWSGGHIPIFINNALKNQDIVIYGNGKQTRSMCYVDDIISGLEKFVRFKEIMNGEIFNIGSTEEMSILDSAKLIIKLTDSKSKIKFVDSKNVYGEYKEISKRFANLEKSKKILNYSKPQDESFERGIKKVIEKWKVAI